MRSRYRRWYGLGMTKQITVRLPDELVDFLDRQVQDEVAQSRAEAVGMAVERARRQALAERDIAILRATGSRDDLGALSDYAAEHFVESD